MSDRALLLLALVLLFSLHCQLGYPEPSEAGDLRGALRNLLHAVGRMIDAVAGLVFLVWFWVEVSG